MDRQIEDRARAGLGVAEAPAVQMFGQIAGVDDPSDQRPANAAGADYFPHGPRHRAIPQMVVGRQHDAGPLAGGDHLPRVLEASRERLLAKDVNPGLRGGQSLGPMAFVGRRDIDRRNADREQLRQPSNRLRDAELLRVGAAARGGPRS